MQVLSISELVKGAITEAEAFGKQGTGSTDVPASVQLGRAAQASIQVKPLCLLSLHNSLPMLFSLPPVISCCASAVSLHSDDYDAGYDT